MLGAEHRARQGRVPGVNPALICGPCALLRGHCREKRLRLHGFLKARHVSLVLVKGIRPDVCKRRIHPPLPPNGMVSPFFLVD